MTFMVTASGQDIQAKSRIREIRTSGSMKDSFNHLLWFDTVTFRGSKEQRNSEHTYTEGNSLV